MTHRIAGAALIATLALTGGAALAFGPGKGMHHGMRGQDMRPSFEELDADGDGQITRAEMQAHRQARFEAADTDGDGKLSPAEMEARAMARVQARVAAMVERLDSDGDGLLSVDEMPARKGMARLFDMVDADDSGAITAEEMAEARQWRHERHRRHGHGYGHGMKKRSGQTD